MNMNPVKSVFAQVMSIDTWNRATEHKFFTKADGIGFFGWNPPKDWNGAADILESDISCFAWRVNGNGNEPFNCVVWYNK